LLNFSKSGGAFYSVAPPYFDAHAGNLENIIPTIFRLFSSAENDTTHGVF